MNKLPVVAIVGRPNVGKSTLFNRLIGRRRAVTSRTPGTTRDSLSEQVNWNGKDFILIDSAGLITDFYGFKEADIEKKAQVYIDEALDQADLVLFLIDAKAGVTPDDQQVAKKLRKFNKRVILVANKADTLKAEGQATQFSSLGFKNTIAISAITGRRSGDLLDKITSFLPEVKSEKSLFKKITIIGRPNVGKSTLFNRLIGSHRAIVSEIAGTTRDSVKFELEVTHMGKRQTFEIIDTAGFRKRGKIEVGIEKFSVIRALEAVYEADIVILVIDAVEGLTRTDAHLVQLAQDKSKRIFIVINKVDKMADKVKEEIPNLDRFEFITKIPMIALSAKTGENVDFLFSELLKIN
jgi:GTP-binding protein